MSEEPEPPLTSTSTGTAMLSNSDEIPSTPLSDNDRLINALQTCFQDLINKQEDHSRKQAEQTEKIYKAVDALKKEPDSDKKTAFWNAYKELADEYDTEFKEKYGSDLDTTLIFAGLFSAVSSAFIIQIQPQIMAPNAPVTKVLVAQSMLYVSLFTTLLAALLAVLGKQWIMFYQAVGGRGTIEDRGLERQRKLDGLRKWKFDAVLQMFPLLLQLALLLFSAAISVYLWTVNRSVPIIMLALTSVGFGVYMLFLGSAIVSRDSPFRTPLAPFLVKIFSPILNKIFTALDKLNWQYLQPFSWGLRRVYFRLRGLLKPVLSCFRWVKPGTHILPRFISHIRSKPTMVNTYPNYDLSGPSAEAAAVLWVLETTTDPTILDLAVEMGVDLQWPLDADLLSPMRRLGYRFLGQAAKSPKGHVSSCNSVRHHVLFDQAHCSSINQLPSGGFHVSILSPLLIDSG
ncbi:hypothetical protein B0H11DRAFT_1116377 [Mycena galericulata]|nr:hypothetical protein B0H11DRAFT_1116377 [Mycena galericulata]